MKTVRENHHLVWLGLAIAILLAEAFVFRESWRRFTESSEYFDRTRLTMGKLQDVVSLVKDAELAQRGFLLTGRQEYLVRCRTAAADLPDELKRLRQMAETSSQEEMYSRLESLITERLGLLAVTVDVRRDRGFAAAAALLNSDHGLTVMRDIETLAAGIVRRQSEVLDRRMHETEEAARITFAVCTAGSGILLLLVAGGALVIHRDIRRRNALLDLTRQQSGIIQFAHEAIMVRDLGGRIMSWNTGAAELYGWSESEAVGRHIHTLLWSRLPIPERELNAILEREGRWYGEIVQRDRRGRELVVETRQVLVRDDAGRPMGILEMIRDITGHKRVEDALRKSRERLELVVRSIELGLFYCDLPFDKLSWDDTCKQHHGVASGEEVTLDIFYARMHPDDREPVRRAIERSIRDGEPCDAVYRILAPGRPPRWIRIVGKAFFDQTGRPVRFDGVTTDVTAQRRAEEELHESRERLMAALSASDTGTFRWRIDTGLLDLDDNIPRIFGQSPEVAPRDLNAMLAMVHPEDRKAVAEAIEEVARAGQTAAGAYSSGESALALLNSRGAAAYHGESMAHFSITAMARDSSGWAKAGSPYHGDFDPTALARRAARKAANSAAPVELPPGRYTVVMEPAAVLDLLGQMFPDFSGTAIRDGRSFLKDRLGEKLFGANITIRDDVYHPLQAGAAFDGEGVPRRRLALVENGRVREIAYSRQAARLAGAEPTGHGLPLPNEIGEMPVNIVMEGGETPLEQMIASTERGILVTRLWYIREVDPYEKIMTGMTRDGTFLIEGGAITSGLRNFRFNQGLVELLGNVEALSQPVRASGEEAFDMVVPAMKARDFNFTEVTRF